MAFQFFRLPSSRSQYVYPTMLKFFFLITLLYCTDMPLKFCHSPAARIEFVFSILTCASLFVQGLRLSPFFHCLSSRQSLHMRTKILLHMLIFFICLYISSHCSPTCKHQVYLFCIDVDKLHLPYHFVEHILDPVKMYLLKFL